MSDLNREQRRALAKKSKKMQYEPSRKFQQEDVFAKLEPLRQQLPGGLFSIVCNENARYTAFTGSLLSLMMPPESRYSIHTGAYVVDSCNRAVMGMRDNEQWICFMGDDHLFPPEFLLKLLAVMYKDDLDIVVPVCFKRSFPPEPVLYTKPDPTKSLYVPIDLNDYPDGGVIEVYAAGSAGMVIRRRVLEAMTPPWFEFGVEHRGEDIHFCEKAQELGFKIHADLDMSLGHILNAGIWPVRSEKGGEWGCQYDFNTQGGFVLEL